MRALVVIFLLAAGGSYWFLQQNGAGRLSGGPGVANGPGITAAGVPHPGLSRFFHGANREHPCVGNRYCLVAYMAPWCPYCKRSLPAYEKMRQMASGTAQLGVALVLSPAGRGFDNATALAERIEGPVYRDEWDRAWSVVKSQSSGGISGVPGWAVYDADGLMVSSSSGAVMQSSESAIKRFLDRRMGMEGRLDF